MKLTKKPLVKTNDSRFLFDHITMKRDESSLFCPICLKVGISSELVPLEGVREKRTVFLSNITYFCPVCELTNLKCQQCDSNLPKYVCNNLNCQTILCELCAWHFEKLILCKVCYSQIKEQQPLLMGKRIQINR